MNILHVLESLDPKGGGLPAAVKDLRNRQIASGNQVDIITDRKFNHCDIKHFSVAEIKDLTGFLSSYNIVHVHGVWNYRLLRTVRLAKSSGCKVIVSFHGQLMPNLLLSDTILKKIKKTIYRKTILAFYVRLSDVIHSVCPEEKDILSKAYPNHYHKTIYNYIDKEIVDKKVNVLNNADWNSIKVITFLGRVERRKGVLNLVKSISNSFLDSYELNIIGPVEDKCFLKEIECIIEAKKSKCKINILPALYGEDRTKALLASHFICLPSYSEVVGLVNIEGALLKRCVITTHQANISEIGVNGGFLVNPTVDSLSELFEVVDKLSYEEYKSRCLSLYEWSQYNFNYRSLDKQWLELINYLCTDT